MTHRRSTALIRIALLPVAAACLSVSAYAATPSNDMNTEAKVTQTAKSQAMRDLRASNLIHKSVKSPEGKNLGQIEDLIVNVQNGDVRYAMLSFDPGVFEGEKLFAVPTKELRMSADGNDLVYNMTRDKLEQAGIDKSKWDTALEDKKYVDGLDHAYGIVQPSNDARAFRASELIGKDVNDKQLRDIGELKDLVVDMKAGKVHYAVLEFDPSWAAPDKLYAFPMSAFKFTNDKDELVLQASREQVQAMKNFDPQKFWASLNDPVWVADIDRYLITVTPTAKGSPAEVFARLDTNHDGKLDRVEARANTGVDSAWARLDRNHDGHVSRDEFTSNYHMMASRS
jgi:sporulation protein YlmC with PRC-barrel domain